MGALAGAVTGLVTTPLDVIKTRLMTQGVSRKYDGIFDCARKIAKQEGAATFFKVSNLSILCTQVTRTLESRISANVLDSAVVQLDWLGCVFVFRRSLGGAPNHHMQA